MNKELIEKLWAETHPGYTGEHKVIVKQDLQQIILTVLDAVEGNLDIWCGATLKHKGYNTSAIVEWLEEDEVLEAINKLR